MIFQIIYFRIALMDFNKSLVGIKIKQIDDLNNDNFVK